MSKKPTDQECVSAFNDCVDLAKYRNLPQYVRNRLPALLKHRRLGLVCFSEHMGFGLKVFGDETGVNVVNYGTKGGDECELGDRGDKSGCLVLTGYWLRCPPAPLPAPEPEAPQVKLLVMNARGARFLRRLDLVRPNPDEDVEDEVLVRDVSRVSAVPVSQRYDPQWTGSRLSAKVFTSRETAEEFAAAVKGVVVQR